MTKNQIDYAALKEQKRANAAKEEENRRSNKASEAETHRANTAKEELNKRVEKRQTISTVADIVGSALNSVREGLKTKSAAAAGIIKLLNDPKWYEISSQITKDVASVPAFQPTGTIPAQDDTIGVKFDILNSTKAIEEEGHRFATAGYCHFSYLPTIGNSFFTSNNGDGVNIAAQNIYSYMRTQVSGSVRNYERADYMMMLLALDGPLSYYSWMKRLYGILQYANLYNKYLPKHLINDMNVDYMDLSNQIANFRGYINQFVVRVNASLAIPSRMPYYARHQFLNTYMFSDSKSKKHQLYFFSPRKYFIWKIDPNNDATMLDLEDPWTYNNVSLLKLTDIVAFGNYMLDQLVNEEDVGIMVGDTVKAFGEGELVQLAEIPDNYVVEIGTSDEILDQITNIRFAKKNVIAKAATSSGTSGFKSVSIVGYDPLNSVTPAKHTFAFNVYQDTSTQQIYQVGDMHVELDCRGISTWMSNIWNSSSIESEEVIVANDSENAIEMNFLTDDTDPERFLTSSRLTPTFEVKNAIVIRNGVTIDKIVADIAVTSCGSEVVVEGFTSVLYWDPTDKKAKVATYELYDGMNEFVAGETQTGVTGTGLTGGEVFISDFDYHPCINIYHTISSGTHDEANATKWIRKYSKLWDRNVSTYVPREIISNMHSAAIMGEFNLAEIGLTPKAKI